MSDTGEWVQQYSANVVIHNFFCCKAVHLHVLP